MQVFPFIAQLCQFSKHDSTHKDLLGAKGVCERRVILEDLAEFTDNIESLKDCVHAIVPLDFSLTEIAIRVVQIAKLVESLNQQVLLLAFAE